MEWFLTFLMLFENAFYFGCCFGSFLLVFTVIKMSEKQKCENNNIMCNMFLNANSITGTILVFNTSHNVFSYNDGFNRITRGYLIFRGQS